jgi:uncharacterized protein Smg (DUF494 family)
VLFSPALESSPTGPEDAPAPGVQHRAILRAASGVHEGTGEVIVMQSRVLEIILYYMENFRKDLPLCEENVPEVCSRLLEKGYAEPEIRDALHWMRGRAEAEGSGREGSRAVRILNRKEGFALRPDAYGYLLSLHSWGVASAEQIEEIIERTVLSFGEDIGRSEVQAVADHLLLSRSRDAEEDQPGPELHH